MEPERKPFWMPDTQGFLAVAIISLMSCVILILLLKDYENLNEKVYGALLTLLGVLAACFKDVYSFFFGSSKGSEKKDDAMIASAIVAAPNGTGGGGLAAIQAAAEKAAPPAAAVAAPPAVDAELDRRGIPDKPQE